MMETQSRNLPMSFAMILNEITKAQLDKPRGVVRVVTTVSEVPFDTLIEDFQRNGIETEFSEVMTENGFKLWKCRASRKIDVYEMEIKGTFHVLTKDFSTYFITGEKELFYKKIIKPITKIAYPNLLRANLHTREIHELLENYSKRTKTTLRYNDFWYKKLFQKAFTVKKHENRMSFEDYEPFENAFREANLRGGWLDRITVFNENSQFTIARNGILKFKKGTFSEYYRYFLSNIADFVSVRWKLFEKKGRSEQPKREVKPIIVNFENDVFDDSALKREFIRGLSKYPNCSYSIIHGGNPHLYLTMLDRVDNSSFSVRTYGTSALLISPQIRTTKAALVRFSTYLLNNFQEGKMTDFQA